MYLYSNKKSLHVRGSIGSRTWFHRFMYVIPWVHIRGRMFHVRGTGTCIIQNILVKPCLHNKVTGVCSNARSIVQK